MFAPELAGIVIAKMLTMAGLLIGSALGPRWLQTAITVGLAAVGIYLQGPQTIWNFAQTSVGLADRTLSVVGWLNVVGTVTRYLGSTAQKSGSGTPKDSLGVDPQLVELRCQHLRELLNREAAHGTQDAAFMSSNAYGYRRLYGLVNEKGAMIVNGRPIDQDWLVDLKAVAHDQGLQAATAVYATGKSVWWAVNQVPFGKNVSGLFREMGERNAIALAGSPATFSQIFDQRFMSKVCPGY